MVRAAYLFVQGIFELVWAFRLRPVKGWGWTLFSGISSLPLGDGFDRKRGTQRCKHGAARLWPWLTPLVGRQWFAIRRP